MTTNKTAWVAGATGLIGGHLIRQLCDHPHIAQVVTFVRGKPQGKHFEHPKVHIHPCHFDQLEAPMNAAPHLLFCALGTTKRKTPDPMQYRRIDVEYPIAFGRLGKESGASSYAVVSAHGASARSLSTYLRLKGEMENATSGLGFDSVIIARPGLLLGDRGEFRLGEKLAEGVTRFLPGNYRAIQAHDVAAAMIAASNQAQSGIQVLSSASMQGAIRSQPQPC